MSDVWDRYAEMLLSKTVVRLTPDGMDHIPHDVLSNVLEGKQPPSVLAKYGHYYTCDLCKSNVEAFTAEGLKAGTISGGEK